MNLSEMSEQARARLVAGSMSVVSAGMVLALVLGLSIVAGHFLRDLGSGSSAGSVTTSRSVGGIVGAPARTQVGPSAQAAAVPANPVTPISHQHHGPGGHPACVNCGPGPATHPGTSIGVGAGPVHASVTVGAGGKNVTAKVRVGPVKAKVTIPPGPAGHVVDAVTKTLCALTC
jgi:hypothetical protein